MLSWIIKSYNSSHHGIYKLYKQINMAWYQTQRKLSICCCLVTRMQDNIMT
jgi:hypothetical protein